MLQTWLLEIAKGIGNLFLNPLLYWVVILFMLTGYRRVKKERQQFGFKVYDIFSEGGNTFGISLLFSIFFSVIAVIFGLVASFEIIVVLMAILFILSITGLTTMLSASYTIGITFLLLLILPFIPLGGLDSYLNFGDLSIVHFICLAIVMGIFLLVEALILGSKKATNSFPSLSLSDRGIWIGEHTLKKLAFIPFFTLIPTNSLGGIAPLFPYFDYGDQVFSLVLLPFFIGYNYKVRGDLPKHAAHYLAKRTFFLSAIVLLCAFGSLMLPPLSFIAILLAIVGKEWIAYKHKWRDKKKRPYFTPIERGVKVLATIPDSPADRLGILIGEVILKVNGIVVTNSSQFYEALQNSGAFFKLDIIDHQGEVRFISSAFYEEDHHELGIIFTEAASDYENNYEHPQVN